MKRYEGGGAALERLPRCHFIQMAEIAAALRLLSVSFYPTQVALTCRVLLGKVVNTKLYQRIGKMSNFLVACRWDFI